MSLIKVRDVNLKQVSLGFETKSSPDSVYRRIQRFFKDFKISPKLVANFVISNLPMDKYVLSMDRTNWKFGKVDINILTIGIVYKGNAFPIAWMLFPKRGNSNQEERISLIKKVLEIIPKDKIDYLLADREFVGKNWFLWLKEEKISFVIRIRDNFVIHKRGKKRAIKTSFRCLKNKHSLSLKESLKICGVKLFATGARVDGEYCIVVSDKKLDNAIDIYLQRWGIEVFFGCAKSRGFNFENTHMSELNKISKLLSLIVIAFTWAHLVGEFISKRNPIKTKKHGRKAISLFRLGLDFIQHSLLNFSLKYHDLYTSLKCLL